MCLNIDSLLKHLDETKLFVKQEMLHVLSVNETKLDENVSDEYQWRRSCIICSQ